MGDQFIRIQVKDRIAVATMDHPPANALSPELRDEFLEKLAALSDDEEVWTVIITGAGKKFFAAGADIPSLEKLNRQSGLERVRMSRRFYSGIASFPKPVIAAINGLCLGGGLELALACDIRVCADHAKLGLPEVNLGIIPGAGGTQRLPRAVGPGWANYLLLTGDAISASKALEIGLVQEVVPLEGLLEKAREIASAINRKAPLAVRAAKRVAREGLSLPLEQGLDLENEAFSQLCETRDKNEGIRAFLEKRKPVFVGR